MLYIGYFSFFVAICHVIWYKFVCIFLNAIFSIMKIKRMLTTSNTLCEVNCRPICIIFFSNDS